MVLGRQAIRRENQVMGIFFLFVALFFLGHSVFAGKDLPLPRFVSLRSGEVNLRVGPGSEYPIEWILKYEKMPVEIIREFGVWRKIRDFEGIEGWVHQSMLSGARTVMVLEDLVILRKKPENEASGLVKVPAGVVGKLLECKDEWCRLQAEGYKGWLLRTKIWGVYPAEFRK